MMLLRMADALELTPDQLSSLEAIRDENRDLHHGHMRDAREARARAAEILAADDPDLAAYEAALREASEHDVQGDLVRARAHLAASRVLTPVQLQALELAARISDRGGEGRGGGGGGRTGGHGMGGQGSGGSGGGPGGG
jgi:Spy/CpxP family protein refolding chaperone